MARCIPNLNRSLGRMTAGERRVARVLSEKLDAGAIVWYDVAVGERGLHPDFIVLDPQQGLLVLEVKDWHPETVIEGDRERVLIQVEGQAKAVAHPLEQARQYAYAVTNVLRKDASLTQSSGAYRGNLSFPFGYGVVMSHWREAWLKGSDWQHLFDPHQTLCQDDLGKGEGEFYERLWSLCPYRFGEPLGAEQIDRVRWYLFPELRIIPRQISLLEPLRERDPIAVAQDLIAVMDLEQETLARNLGDGHRVIHGVAGSGKTLILLFRARHLAKSASPESPVLCLCYNVTLAAKLRGLLAAEGLGERVEVASFHAWCRHQLSRHHQPLPCATNHSDYSAELVTRMSEAIATGQIPSGQYHGVLIDEAHDFAAEWLQLAVSQCNPATNHLLILYDDAQTLYGRQGSQRVGLGFSLKSVGIQASGRTTILQLNYRNTREILQVAYTLVQPEPASSPSGTNLPVHPQLHGIIAPTSAGRCGPMPELVKRVNLGAEARWIAERIQQWVTDQGWQWRDIAVLYRTKAIAQQLVGALRHHQIPVEWVNKTQASRNRFDGNENSVKVLTLYASKGLEFRGVAIAGVGHLPDPREELESEARLLYVGMTRAMDELALTYSQESPFVERIRRAIAP